MQEQTEAKTEREREKGREKRRKKATGREKGDRKKKTEKEETAQRHANVAIEGLELNFDVRHGRTSVRSRSTLF